MTASSTTTAALVTGSLLVAAGLYTAFSKKGGEGTSRDLVEIDDEMNEEDFITPEEVAKVFDRLFMELQAVFSQLMQQIQQIQMSGQRIPEAQLQALLKGELERALVSRQKMVLDEYDMDYECLEQATWEFLEDEEKFPKVKVSVDRFQKFWESTTGQKVTGWRKGQAPKAEEPPVEPLSPERTIEAAEKYFEGITNSMRALVREYKEAGKDLRQPAIQNALHMDFSSRADGAGTAALEEAGVTMAQFQASVKAHSQNENVARSMAMMQMKQQQELSGMASA